MQSQNRFFEDFAKLANGAAGTFAGVAREMESMAKSAVERFMGGIDMVSRDEFEAVKEMAANAPRRGRVTEGSTRRAGRTRESGYAGSGRQEGWSRGVSTSLAEIGGLWMVGCGNMGGALLDRWLASGLSADRVTVIDPNAASPAGVRSVTAPEGKAPRVVVLAVKPQMFETAAEALTPCLTPDTLVVSIVAGIRLDRMRARFGERVLRTMPNTPARVGKGVTGLFGDVPDEDRALGEALASAVGRPIWLDAEVQFDALTGLSGSGPAYVFAMIESLARAGEAAGLSAEIAATMARDTVIGAAALADASDETPATLRERVTSPKGTTQAGLEVLQAPLDDLMVRTVAAAAARSEELGA